MDLSNDDSNFGYGEINERIPINSHIQEDFMVEDDGIMKQIPSGCILRRWTLDPVEHITLNEDALMQQEEDVIKASYEGKKRQLFGIKDPKIVATKGTPKGKGKGLVVSHTRHTCLVYVGTKPCTISLQYSHVDPVNNVSTNSRSARDVLMRLSLMLTLRGSYRR
ncbi:hypothetical protein Cgig2_005776 [Carnegiea gigantea]|uniref:Uncharacterized protein n=1 Tax=Carnegiea gigantea TaxID=171969 RepID=A0A9Q1Q9N0_9CARY|nr:hypothetical protein Cgig2_005776 [Carnegiea gigantea]